MTPDEIRALTDEQLDIAIAERVYGLTNTRIDRNTPDSVTGLDNAGDECLEIRATDNGITMLLLIEAMGQRGWFLTLESPAPGGKWLATFRQISTKHEVYSLIPHRAVAEAALAAVTAEVAE